MGKLYGLFYGITCNTQAGSGHYRIYVVYTGWNSFDLTLSHHTNIHTYTPPLLHIVNTYKLCTNVTKKIEVINIHNMGAICVNDSLKFTRKIEN